MALLMPGSWVRVPQDSLGRSTARKPHAHHSVTVRFVLGHSAPCRANCRPDQPASRRLRRGRASFGHSFLRPCPDVMSRSLPSAPASRVEPSREPFVASNETGRGAFYEPRSRNTRSPPPMRVAVERVFGGDRAVSRLRMSSWGLRRLARTERLKCLASIGGRYSRTRGYCSGLENRDSLISLSATGR